MTSISKFEEGWEEHMKKLKKYIMNSVQFKEWQQLTVSGLKEEDRSMFEGQTYFWFNSKSGIKQSEHPGVKYF